MKIQGKKLGLVLSGGLTWGLCHIGVLAVLAEAEIRVDMLAGTSVGSLVGALYAAGYSASQLEALARRTHWRDLIKLQAPRLGLVGTKGFTSYLERHLGEVTFAQLQVPLAVVTCDLNHGKEVVLNTGPVVPAVIASCALPGIFTPVDVNGQLLIDGGVVNNLPVGVAQKLGAEVVIAVDLGAKPIKWGPPENIFQVIVQSIMIMQRTNVEQELPSADVVIQPQITELSFLDLENIDPYLASGRAAAQAALPEIKKLLGL